MVIVCHLCMAMEEQSLLVSAIRPVDLMHFRYAFPTNGLGNVNAIFFRPGNLSYYLQKLYKISRWILKFHALHNENKAEFEA